MLAHNAKFYLLGFVQRDEMEKALLNRHEYNNDKHPFEKRCEICKGFGKVEFSSCFNDWGEYTYEYVDCPYCKGKRVIMTETPEIELIVGGFDKEIIVYFSREHLDYLQKVLNLMTAMEIQTTKLYYSHNNGFRFVFGQNLESITFNFKN